MLWDAFQRGVHETLPLDQEPRTQLLNGALGLVCEAGEVGDRIKKNVFHGQSLDLVRVREELGDVCWYLALLLETTGVTLEDVLTANREKLTARYSDELRGETA